MNTCWFAMTHGKSALEIGRGEKQACLIALGYGAKQGTDHAVKNPDEICNCVNRQKFYFTLDGDSVSAGVKGRVCCLMPGNLGTRLTVDSYLA